MRTKFYFEITGIIRSISNEYGVCQLLVVVVLFWAVQLNAAEQHAPAHRALLSKLDAVRFEHKISTLGLALVDVESGSRKFNLVAASGSTDHGNESLVTTDSIFRLGSLTKSFNGIAVLRLQEQGRLKLDQRLADLVSPGLWQNPWRESFPVTLAQLLEHSAGFPDISRAEFDNTEILPLADALRKYAPVHNVRWRPGMYASYSNLGAGLAGLAMETVTGRSYEQVITDEVLRPLGMNDSGFDPTRVGIVGYDRDGTTVIPFWNMVYRPFGALNASVNDMARFVRWHLEQGRGRESLLQASAYARMERPGTGLAVLNGLVFGYGLGHDQWLRDGVLFYGHGGDADGYLARFGYSHELGRGYFLVINAFNNRAFREMRLLVENHLIADFDAATAPEVLEVSAASHPWVEGDYAPQTRRFGALNPGSGSVPFRIRGGRVQFRDSENWINLPAVKAEPDSLLLRRTHHNRATAILVRTPEGIVYFIDDSRNYRRISP